MMTSRTITALASKAPSASNAGGLRKFTRWALALGTALSPVWALAQDLPTGGTVIHGAAQISTPNANTMTINQGSDRAVVNWDGFSIGAGNRVDINQPNANSAILNRVTGDTTSQIHGQINANGRVFVVNPNGIFIGPTGSVNAGGFVASTLAIRTDDFVTGNTVFEGNGSSATVSNEGNIQVVTGGYAALIGGKVKNSGTIQAPLGFVGLGSGERITLDLSGDGFLQVAVPTNSDDDGLEALIENSGTLQANGGTVQISAATARNAARQAINMSGVIEARTVSGRNGRVTLGGGLGGKVRVTGKVRTKTRRPAIQVTQSARPTLRPERGGDITITGREIALAGADIDASGTDGGGTIRIGGEFQGGVGLPRAQQLNVDTATIIAADGIENGDGGRVILWSDERTEFAGNISARGGSNGGNGGFVEVSGKETLRFSGLADTRAENGDWGTLLLDPNDIFIVSVLTGNDGDVLASTIEAALAVNNAVEIQTTAGAGPDEGRIEVNAPLTWATNSTLSLIASTSPVLPTTADAIIINAPITATNGHLILAASESFGTGPPESRTISTGPNGNINVGTFQITIGDWEQVGILPTFTAGNFVLAPTFTTSFLRATSGDGMATPYQLTDVYGLQGVGTNSSSNYELANDIDASPAFTWRGLAEDSNSESNRGIVPLDFDGTFNGNRNTISNLYVQRYGSLGESLNAGLFDTLGTSASVSQLSLESATIGGGTAGILAAENNGFVFGVSVSGLVQSWGQFAGGVVGVNDDILPGDGILSGMGAVRANVIVSSAFDPTAGGLIFPPVVELGGIAGRNNASIAGAKAEGQINIRFVQDGYAGGIAGVNSENISNSYSLVDVRANSSDPLTTSIVAGGITGSNLDDITNVLADAPVSMIGTDGSIGAITGIDDPDPQGILSSFFNQDTNGPLLLSGTNGEDDGDLIVPSGFEGAIAATTAQLRSPGGFGIAAGLGGWDFLNVWAIPQDGIDQARLYVVDPVITAFDTSDPDAVFVYNGTVDNFSAPNGVQYGGPANYQFGPLGDAGDLTVLDDQIVLSDSNVGPITFIFPTSYTSDMGQAFDVRSFDIDGSITPAPLTVTIGDVNKPFGTELTFAGVPFTPTGFFVSDNITSGTVSSAGAPANTPVSATDYPLTLAGLAGTGLSNYTVNVIPGRLRVVGRSLNVTINDAQKLYGDELLFYGTEFTVVGLLNADTLTTLTIQSDGAVATAQVADNAFEIFGHTPVGTGLQNYSLSITPGKLVINPAPLTVTADDISKPFGTAFTFSGDEFTVTGLLNSDSVTSASFSSVATDADAPLSGAEGSAILISNPAGTGLDNYEVTLVDGVMIVAPGNLTITAIDQTKVYGTEFTFDGTEFTVVGLAEGDSVDSVTLNSDGAAGTAQRADGPFAIVASDAVGTGLDNYALIFADGSFTIVPAPLSVTADNQTKQQGQAFTFAGTEFTTVGLLNADTVDNALLTSDGAAIAALAEDSTFDILVGDVSGTGLDNYEIATVNGTFTVQNLITAPIPNPIPHGGNSLPNPPDRIDISFAFPGDAGTGRTSTPQERGGGTGGPGQTLPQAKATLGVVDTISTEMEQQAETCGSGDQDFSSFMTCLSESLDTYANALDEIANDLPSGLETVSATIRTARDEIRAAAAKAQTRLAGATTAAERRAIQRAAIDEARGAISKAKTEIRKAISLIRADDPEVAAVQRQTGARIVRVFDTVDSALVRAVEL